MRGSVEPVRPRLRETESLASPPVPGLRPRVTASQPGEEPRLTFFEHVLLRMVGDRLDLRSSQCPPQDYYEPMPPPAASCVGGPAWSKAQGSESCPVGVRRFKSCPTHQVACYDGRFEAAPSITSSWPLVGP